MDWSLLGCGARGHVTFAPDEPELRERLVTTTRSGPAWRCLRCGTFVAGAPTASGPAAEAPRVRRGTEIRSALILRVFAVERYLRALLFGLVAIGIWRFSVSRLSIEDAYNDELPVVRSILRQLGFNVNHTKLLGLIQHAFSLNSSTLAWLAIAAAGYAVIEVIEGTGLWLLKRWGEYFALVATSIFLPYEVYDLAAKVTPLRLGAFVVNLALVVYLLVTRRLFGLRGGKKAYEARMRSESILDNEISAMAAERASASGRGTGPAPTKGMAPGAPAQTPVQAQPGGPSSEDGAAPAAPNSSPTPKP
jgi:uncharacterized membrane protein (DUF2068 family)